jgi:pSer/pThr/pTyr-binding forkhead associated (FHA) protein
MTRKLIEYGEGEKRREIALRGEEFTIGRGKDCDLRLTDASISRHHCQIRFKGREATLLDLGSSNGTFLNGKRIRTPTPVHSGDEIQVNEYHFVVDLGDMIDLDAETGGSVASTLKLPSKRPSTQPPEEPRS